MNYRGSATKHIVKCSKTQGLNYQTPVNYGEFEGVVVPFIAGTSGASGALAPPPHFPTLAPRRPGPGLSGSPGNVMQLANVIQELRETRFRPLEKQISR